MRFDEDESSYYEQESARNKMSRHAASQFCTECGSHGGFHVSHCPNDPGDEEEFDINQEIEDEMVNFAQAQPDRDSSHAPDSAVQGISLLETDLVQLAGGSTGSPVGIKTELPCWSGRVSGAGVSQGISGVSPDTPLLIPVHNHDKCNLTRWWIPSANGGHGISYCCWDCNKGTSEVSPADCPRRVGGSGDLPTHNRE